MPNRRPTLLTTTAACHRHDSSDRAWAILEPILPGGPGKAGRPAQNNRRFINGVFRVLRTGAPWRDLPTDYGHWGSTYNRFRNWQKDGTWERFLDTLANDPDLEWLMIDYSYVKAHQHGGSVSFQVVWLIKPCSCNSASRLCSVHTVPSFSRRRNSRLCRSKRDVVRCDACPVAR